MLFLAVTLGFLVENQREHYIERLRAHEFAKTLRADLIADSSDLSDVIMMYDEAANGLDTFLQILNNRAAPGGSKYFYADGSVIGYRMAFHNTTLDQLKSSGSLRYFPVDIRNKLAGYDYLIQEFNLRQNTEPFINIETRKYFEKLFDYRVMNILKMTKDKDSIELFKQTDYALLNKDLVLMQEFANHCYQRMNSWKQRNQFMLRPIKQKAVALIQLLSDNYHLE